MADAKKPKAPTGTTPVGVAVYPRLNKPDTKFNPAGNYSTKLVLSAEDAAPLMEAIEKVAEEAYENAKATLEAKLEEAKAADKPKVKKKLEKLVKGDMPFAPEYDDAGDETGNIVFSFKTNASYTDKKTQKTVQREVTMFDAKGKKLEGSKRPSIWAGSKLSVAYMLSDFYNAATDSAGCSPRLNAVQIVELVSGSGGNAASYGFGSHDSGYEADDGSDDDNPFGDKTGGGGDSEDDDPDNF